MHLYQTQRLILFVLALVALGADGIALVAEKALDLPPCQLCIYQRYIFAAIFLVAILSCFLKNARHQVYSLLGTACLFLGNAGVAFYQVLVEKKLIPLPQLCEASQIHFNAQPPLLEKLFSKASVPCDDVAWSLFGISMAGYNLLFCIMFSFGCFLWALLQLEGQRVHVYESS